MQSCSNLFLASKPNPTKLRKVVRSESKSDFNVFCAKISERGAPATVAVCRQRYIQLFLHHIERRLSQPHSRTHIAFPPPPKKSICNKSSLNEREEEREGGKWGMSLSPPFYTFFPQSLSFPTDFPPPRESFLHFLPLSQK